MNLKQSDAVVYGISSTSSGTVALYDLGTIGYDKVGRKYRYALVDAGAALVAGNVVQGPATVPNHLAATAPAVSAGDTSLTFTPGATLGTASQYVGGVMQVDTTPGNGLAYGIQKQPAFASATAFTLTLWPDDAVQVALTTASRLGLIPNPYAGVIQCPVTTATGLVVGVAVSAIAAGSYGWILVRGVAPVLINGTPALGATVVAPSGTTAGAVDVITTTNLVTAQRVGRMMQVGVSTKNNAVYVELD